MGARAAAVIGRVVRATETSDRELLRRFAAGGDQAAFAAIVRRHAGLVFGVCRRALCNDTDAEDACQAVFVVLAREAGKRQWQASVANWLYATARKVSRNARVAADRRAKREGRAAVPEAVTDLDRMTGREAFAILDEELDRLPPRYREPLVLCYLQGLTRDEAATRLGVSPITLKSQLDRGRKRLAAALTRRGVTLGLGLLAATSAPAAACSPRLAAACAKAVAGHVSPGVAALVNGAVAAGVIQKTLLGLVLAVATVAVGFGLGQPRNSSAGPAQDKEMPAKGAKAGGPPAKPAPDTKAPDVKGPAVAGRVLSPDGKALAGATILLVGKGDKVAELGTTGADGKFHVRLPADWKGAYLVARAKDVGIDFVDLGGAEPKGEIEFKTVADLPVHGRLVDTEGKPVAGAAVRVDRLGTSPGNTLGPILDHWKKLKPHEGDPSGEKQMWHGPPSLWAATTDKDGHFTFRGLGLERLAVLRISGAGATETQAFVAVREKFDPKEYNDAVLKNAQGRFGGKPRWRLYGPDPTVVAEHEKLIRGRVFDVDTNKPRVGITVRLTRTDGDDLLQVAPEATTDQDGHYEIHGAKKAHAYMVEVEADTKAGYLQAQGRAADSTGYDPLTIDIRVKKGVIVTGRLLDQGTGKPVAGFVMVGVPEGNPSIKDYPEFGSVSHFPFERTDAEGRFRVVGIPGPVLLMGGPNGWAAFDKYKPPEADPKYPKFFKKFGDHTAYYMPGGAISPLQGRVCKVVELKAGTEATGQDLELVPAGKKDKKKK